MLRNEEARRITALIVMVTIVFVMFFSIEYISRNADHECTGDDCPVCAMVAQCANNIKTSGAATVAVAVACVVSLFILKSVQCDTFVCLYSSLITRKVRMND